MSVARYTHEAPRITGDECQILGCSHFRRYNKVSLVLPVFVIDDYDQTTHSGEINVPWHEGVLGDEDIYGQIGEIVVGGKEGRVEGDGISVFDSTGLAIQDVAAAHVVYEHADENDNGYPFDLLGLAE